MTPKERIRRVVLLCSHFLRNLVYYRIGHPGEPRNENRDFWITVNSSFLDMAVLEWCKLFGEINGAHHWRRVVSDHALFEKALLSRLNMSAVEFEKYRQQMRAYRDKFLAHLDSEMTMHIPHLDIARAAVEFYHDFIVQNEAQPGDLNGLPDSKVALARYSRNWAAEAKRVYSSL